MKHLLVLFAFILVSLAPVNADEGYIPYFPDFLEPDGIGFRGPAEISNQACWSTSAVACKDVYNTPAGVPWSDAYTNVRSSPITVEYRKDYFYKRLLYFQSSLNIDNIMANRAIKYHTGNISNYTSVQISDVGSGSIIDEMLTSEEKSKLSTLDSSRFFDIKTESTFLAYGYGIGLDLWIFEFSKGIFLMYHDTNVTFRTCKAHSFGGSSGSERDFPTKCQFNPEDIINIDKQNYRGFAFGEQSTFSTVFYDKDNWRISMEFSQFIFSSFLDSNSKPLKYRGLKYYPKISSSSGLGCGDYYLGSGENRKKGDCKNPLGEDMSYDADYTGGLQITYYFK